MIASKQVKPCTCADSCRAKHGQYGSESEAREALARLESGEGTVAPPAAPQDTVPAIPSSSYFEDDEEVLASQDQLLEISQTALLVQQNENMVATYLENFLDEDGKPRSRRSLRANPPIFIIEALSGDRAEFLLTEKMAAALAATMEDARRAYEGREPKRGTVLDREEHLGKLQELQAWFRSNPLRATALTVLFILVVVTLLVA